MSEPDDEWASGKRARVCGDKFRYYDRDSARRGIKRVCQQLGQARSQWRAYRCPYCQLFHIGHRTDQHVTLDTVMDALALARAKHQHLCIPRAVDDGAAALNVHRPEDQRRWARRTAEALRSLEAYGAAKHRHLRPFSGNFYTFCQHSQSASLPLSAVKLNESPMLLRNERLAEQRVFPVDAALDPSGWLLMESHLHVQQRGNPAPRIYFYDDTRGSTGKVHIGYVGKHLDNTHTARSM